MINQEVLRFILEKSKIPNATKAGIFMSWFVFELFDIKGLVKEATPLKYRT